MLKWPGSTTSVRALSVDPSGDIRGERSIFFTRRDEDTRCTIRSSNPAYAPMMWPLGFPDGMPAVLAATAAYPGEMLDEATSFGLSRRTMALLMQPERDADGSFVTVPTPSPYGPGHPDVQRRFSRFELMGRLGDELILDRYLTAQDLRLNFLRSHAMQRRLVATRALPTSSLSRLHTRRCSSNARSQARRPLHHR